MGNANDTKKYIVSNHGKDLYITDTYQSAKDWIAQFNEYPDAVILRQTSDGWRSLANTREDSRDSNKRTHYVSMSGSHGCIPDYCEVHDTYEDAVENLAEIFELGRTRKARLKRDSYLELKPNPVELNMDQDFGAEYCEITECDCDNPAQHSDSLQGQDNDKTRVCGV